MVGLSRYIREYTSGGKRLVSFMVRVWEGKVFWAKGKDGKRERQLPTLADRIEAATWLADRGFGRPLQPMEIEGEVRPPFIIALRQPIQIEGKRVDAPAERSPAPVQSLIEPEEELLTFEPPPEEPTRKRRGKD